MSFFVLFSQVMSSDIRARRHHAHQQKGERVALMDLWAFSKETLLMSGAEALLCACVFSVILLLGIRC